MPQLLQWQDDTCPYTLQYVRHCVSYNKLMDMQEGNKLMAGRKPLSKQRRKKMWKCLYHPIIWPKTSEPERPTKILHVRELSPKIRQTAIIYTGRPLKNYLQLY